jgi:S-adenosylmethionine-dependent methyltransferase
MTQLDTARFQYADRYVEYLGTTEGRLRLDLGWMNLREFLPVAAATSRALDVGSGTGSLALRLAELGFKVDLLDGSAPMLAFASEQANAKKLSHRTSCHLGDAANLPHLFESSSFDAVVCHNLLEYTEEPLAVLRGLLHVLKKDGKSVVSVLVRNRWGEVLKAAIKGREGKLVKDALRAEMVNESLYGQPVRVFDPTDIRSMMEQAGLHAICERGVRVASDYMDRELLTEDAYQQRIELELLMGAQSQLAAIARYTQIIARPVPDPGMQI